ncbi:hypothetical protein Glove_444g14 [Diversispora epigaea]|uniref:Uncharacterized protein n=1 Tax=Diversispora epigaea TaxID=1348612 RepID=A0A397GSD7_9GLOM|nr:hypothetical protein Glove_444g14 [Diversispora epigaea]
MAHLVFKNEALLLEEPLESLCGASAIYLTIENNILSSFEQVRDIVERAINSSLLKIEEIERKIKVSEVSNSNYKRLYKRSRFKAFKVLVIKISANNIK